MAQLYRSNVDLQGVPSARLGVQASPGAFGSPIGREAQDLAALSDQMFKQERAKQDATVLMEADLKAKLLYNKMLYDPDSGAMNVKGKNALGLHERVLPEFQKGLGEIESSLSTQEQRDAFARISSSHVAQMDASLMTHASGQINEWQDSTAQASLDAERQSVSTYAAQAAEASSKGDQIAFQEANDAASKAIANQRRIIETHAAIRGLGQDVANQKIAVVESESHRRVIDAMLSTDQDIAAKSYFDANKGKIVGNDLEYVTKQLELGSTRNESRRLADQALKEALKPDGTLDLAKANDFLNGIKDTKLMDVAKSRFKSLASDHDEAEKAAISSDFRYIQDAVKDATSLQEMKDIVSEAGVERYVTNADFANNVDKYFKWKAENIEPVQDAAEWSAYTQLVMGDAKDPKKLAEMTPEQFELQYRPVLTNSHYQHALGLYQQSLVEANKAKPGVHWDETRSMKEEITGYVGRITKNWDSMDKWTAEQRQFYNAFYDEATLAVSNAQEDANRAGKKLAPSEIRKIIGDTMLGATQSDGVFRTRIQLLQMKPEDRRVDYETIPAADIESLKERAKKIGAPFTDKAAISRAYVAMLLRQPEEAINAALKPAPRYKAPSYLPSGPYFDPNQFNK
jgi:hypothetical protein